MNDFTKEELISLKEHVDTSFSQGDETEALMIKLQSLIDNYCEHKEKHNDLIERLENYLMLIKKEYTETVDINNKEASTHWGFGFFSAVEMVEKWLLEND